MPPSTVDNQQLLAALREVVTALGPLTQQPTPELPGGFRPQTPFTLLTKSALTGIGKPVPVEKPVGYNNAIFRVQVTQATSINCQAQDGTTSGAVANVSDANGTQASIANKTFQVDGVQPWVTLNVTAVTGATANTAIQIEVAWTNATRPGLSADTQVVNQGTANSVANGWPVEITDLTSVVGIDNATALKTSLYEKGSGVAADTAVRISTQLVDLKAVAIVSGTPVSEYAPASGKSFVVMGGAVSVDMACSLILEDGSGTEVARTPVLQPGVNIDLSAILPKNGLKSTAANNHLFLDTSANVGVTVHVSGTLTLAGDE